MVHIELKVSSEEVPIPVRMYWTEQEGASLEMARVCITLLSHLLALETFSPGILESLKWIMTPWRAWRFS